MISSVVAAVLCVGGGDGQQPPPLEEIVQVSTHRISRALERVRGQVGASAVLFLGDDVTDEDAFATLAGPDMGVKVGRGSTIAPFRVGSPDEVAVILAALCARRAAWLAGAGVKGGMSYGATDEFGFKAADNPITPHDFHATILHLLGLDHERLTFYHNGIQRRLTDVHGHVIKEVLT